VTAGVVSCMLVCWGRGVVFAGLVSLTSELCYREKKGGGTSNGALVTSKYNDAIGCQG